MLLPPPTNSQAAWKIVPVAGDQFQWSPIAAPADAALAGDQSSGDRLPSLVDLLLQVQPKHLQIQGDAIAKGASHLERCAPMFSTASGKYVAVKQSSIRTAAAFLEEEGNPGASNGCEYERAAPMFSTASGKSVAVKQSSIIKAAAFLEEEGDQAVSYACDDERRAPMFDTAGKSVAVKQSSVRKVSVFLEEGGDTIISNGSVTEMASPLFSTASGKSVTLKQSSISKAACLLQGENFLEGDAALSNISICEGMLPMFSTGSGKSVTVNQSSIKKAMAVLEAADVQNGEAIALSVGAGEGRLPMFSSGSGKSVTVKQSSLRRAEAFLEGLDIQTGSSMAASDCAAQITTGSWKPVAVKQSSVRKAATFFEGAGVQNGDVMVSNGCSLEGTLPLFISGGKSVVVKQSSIRKAEALLCGADLRKDELLGSAGNSACSFSKSVFQTGSGKALNVSPAGLTKATTLLGLQECNSPLSASLFDPTRQFYTDQFTVWGCATDRTMENSLAPEVHTSAVVDCTDLLASGGRYVSASSNALKWSRNLLGNIEMEAQPRGFGQGHASPLPLRRVHKSSVGIGCSKEKLSSVEESGKDVTDTMTQSTPMSRSAQLDTVEVGNFQDSRYRHQKLCADMTSIESISRNSPHATATSINISHKVPGFRTSRKPLVDISNCASTHTNSVDDAIRFRRRSSISPYKKPRLSRFTSPLDSSISLPAGLFVPSAPRESCCRNSISSHYPAQSKRKDAKDFFGCPPGSHNLLIPDEVKCINAETAEKYRFLDENGIKSIGPDNFQIMLLQSGASVSNATKEWVTNHYKWVVWKLACYERNFTSKVCGSFLTVSNVLTELKYRYEREFNYGHRSAIKKMLDGDASPSCMIILCVSAIHSLDLKISKEDETADVCEGKINRALNSDMNRTSRIELTDGWYPLTAYLDRLLSKQLADRRIFVGQKLRIWGANLCGWTGPISPLEAVRTVGLLAHMNGTYRAYWGSPLGFCKSVGAPLAFRCIKSAGGSVPRTLVGIARVYPILYKERYDDGGSVVRSERMEIRALHIHNLRRSNIMEDITSRHIGLYLNKDDATEGAKIYKMLENAAEPEVIMADMTPEQLTSFFTYKERQEANRQVDMKKKIEKAFKEAGLSSRDVTPFMKVKVVGLSRKGSSRKHRYREGVVTIWNPTEKQKSDLVEGHVYSVSGLIPLSLCSEAILLKGRGPSMQWRQIPFPGTQRFEPFFNPRSSVKLSNLGEVPLASEFDTAAVIVHVGEVYVSSCGKKQWIFVSDGSKSSSAYEEPNVYLLAISFCEPATDNDGFPLLSHTLSGNVVAFCNLVKRTRDEVNNLWVAEATELSTYSASHNLPGNSYLKDAAVSAQKWAKTSSSTIERLKQRVLYITCDRET